VVAGNTVNTTVGGDLTIQSLQDTSTYNSQQSSSGGGVSICVPPFCYGTSSASASAGKSNVNSNYASVNEQSGIQAGDGGFNVAVAGDTTLVGGAISSTQAAVNAGLNSFTTGGTLTTSDIQNTAAYDANGYQIGASLSTQLGDQSSAQAQQAMQDQGMSTALIKQTANAQLSGSSSKPSGSAGIGSASGNAGSITASGISGIAGNTAVRTGSQETGIAPIFDQAQVQKDIDAQVQITAAFGSQASKAWGTYADNQANDPTKTAEERAQWAEGGSLRSIGHAAIGGLTGGAAGAAGQGASALAAPTLNDLQASIAAGLVDAGLPQSVATAAGQLVSGATAAGLGAAVGGTAGAAAAFNGDLNNRQLHVTETEAIKRAAMGDKEKEARLTKAACYAVKCWAQYPEGSVEREKFYVSPLELSGLATEMAWVNAQAASSNLFGYSDWAIAKDAFQAGPLPTIQNGGKVVGGGLAVATGNTICVTSGLGCVVGVPLAAFGASEAIEGGTGLYNSFMGQGSQGYNPIRIGFNAVAPVWGDTAYDATFLLLSAGAIGARVPLQVGASDGINRVNSLFGVTVPRWQNPIINPLNKTVLLPQTAAQGSLLYGVVEKVPAVVEDVKKAQGSK